MKKKIENKPKSLSNHIPLSTRMFFFFIQTKITKTIGFKSKFTEQNPK